MERAKEQTGPTGSSRSPRLSRQLSQGNLEEAKEEEAILKVRI